MDQLPGFTQWPVFRETIFVFSEVLNFIFNRLNDIGIINVVVSVVFFSLFYQLLLLPFGIHRGLKATKGMQIKAELELLEREYKDKLNDPALLAEYNAKKESIKAKKKKKKRGMGLLLFFAQFFLVMCALNTIAYMTYRVGVLASMDESALTEAYTLFGMDLRTSASDNLWPAILFVLLYVAIFTLPNVIRKHIANKREKEKWLESLSEEERLAAKKEEKKMDVFSVFMSVTKFIPSALILYLGISVPVLLIIYWTINVIWKEVLFYVSKFLYRKAIPAVVGVIKKKEGKIKDGNN